MNRKKLSGTRLLRLVGIVLMLLVAVSACGDDTADDAAAADEDATETTAAADAPVDEAPADDGAAGTDGATGDFETVFGIPPYGSAVVSPGLEFRRQEDEYGFGEDVDFTVEGAELRQVVDFYVEVLEADGFEVSEIDLGGGAAFSVSGELPNDGSSRTIAMVQIGPRPSGSTTLGITQTLANYIS